jgi:hypothetical protein
MNNIIELKSVDNFLLKDSTVSKSSPLLSFGRQAIFTRTNVNFCHILTKNQNNKLYFSIIP